MVAQTTQQTARRTRSFRLRPIGYVRTSYGHPEETPTQAPLNPDEQGLLVIYPRYAPALAVMAEVQVQVEPGQMVAAITDASRDELGLKEGDEVTVVIESTEVLIAK